MKYAFSQVFMVLLMMLSLCSCVKNQNTSDVNTSGASVNTLDPNVNTTNYPTMLRAQSVRAQEAATARVGGRR